MRKIFIGLIAAAFATLSVGVFAAAEKVDCAKLEKDQKDQSKWTKEQKDACAKKK